MEKNDWNLVDRLNEDEEREWRLVLRMTNPDAAKYWKATKALSAYLSAEAEWRAFAYVQKVFLETRMEFGQAEKWHVDEVVAALEKIDPLNMMLLEEDKRINHDQLAVLEEIGRFVSPETKALLHPGTTSYDVVDTARAYLFKKAWCEVIRPEVNKAILKLCDISERSGEMLQVGRTHLQDTSPVPLGLTFSIYAARLAGRVERCEDAFLSLRGKVSGIVGTGAGIDMVVGVGKSLSFESAVLKKLDLEPDYTATQITSKEVLSDAGHSLTTLALVLVDFANDIRMLYSSAIGEVTSRDNADRLGGSSTDAMKNNPINYENNAGKGIVIASGMSVLYEMIHSDFMRDLRNSVQGRYQPQSMMVETYEMFARLNRSLSVLSINEDRMAQNLMPVRENPSEAMVTILRGEKWIHPELGVGHDFVKEMGRRAKKTGRPLLVLAQEDEHFERLYVALPRVKQDILQGKLEEYVGSSRERMEKNVAYARNVVGWRDNDGKRD